MLRHLSPTAKPVAAMGSTMELYEEGERFWLIDDRWGLTEMNLLKGQFQSWILPRPAIDPGMIVQDAVLWPLAQLLRGKGLSLVPGISVAAGWVGDVHHLAVQHGAGTDGDGAEWIQNRRAAVDGDARRR